MRLSGVTFCVLRKIGHFRSSFVCMYLYLWVFVFSTVGILPLLYYYKRASKKRIFYGQVDRKGGRVSAPWTLTVSKRENVDPFFSLNFDSLILKTHFFLIVRGLKNALFMSLTPLLPISLSDNFVKEQQQAVWRISELL